VLTMTDWLTCVDGVRVIDGDVGDLEVSLVEQSC